MLLKINYVQEKMKYIHRCGNTDNFSKKKKIYTKKNYFDFKVAINN